MLCFDLHLVFWLILICRNEILTFCYTEFYPHHPSTRQKNKACCLTLPSLFPLSFQLGTFRNFQLYLHPLSLHHSSHHSPGSSYQEGLKVQLQAAFPAGHDKDLLRFHHTLSARKRWGKRDRLYSK